MRIPTLNVSGSTENNNIYLTSGIQPPTTEGNLVQQTKVQADMQSYASGGSIMHVFLNEEMDAEHKSKFISKMFNNFPIRYISLTPFLSICNECGEKHVGKINTCINCNSADVSIWSRPIGYVRPVMRSNINDSYTNADFTFWTSSKIHEFANRRNILIDDINEFIDESTAGV